MEDQMNATEIYTELSQLKELVRSGIVDAVLGRLNELRGELSVDDFSGLVYTLRTEALLAFKQGLDLPPRTTTTKDIANKMTGNIHSIKVIEKLFEFEL
jgi:hypothetical protein